MAGKAKRATWSEVRCETHGKTPLDPRMPKSVRVGTTGTRKNKNGGGFPECKKANKA